MRIPTLATVLLVSGSAMAQRGERIDPPGAVRMPPASAEFRALFLAPVLDTMSSLESSRAGHVAGHGGAIVLPARRRTRDRFAAELQGQTLRSRGASVYGNLTEDMAELLDDNTVGRQRSRAARSIIGNTVGAAIGFAFHGEDEQPSTTVRPDFAVVKKGIQFDASPEWTFRRVGPRTGLRIGLPLTPDAFRLKCWRDLRGTDRNPMRLGAGISIDPFDRTIRCGMSFEF